MYIFFAVIVSPCEGCSAVTNRVQFDPFAEREACARSVALINNAPQALGGSFFCSLLFVASVLPLASSSLAPTARTVPAAPRPPKETCDGPQVSLKNKGHVFQIVHHCASTARHRAMGAQPGRCC